MVAKKNEYVMNHLRNNENVCSNTNNYQLQMQTVHKNGVPALSMELSIKSVEFTWAQSRILQHLRIIAFAHVGHVNTISIYQQLHKDAPVRKFMWRIKR